MIKRRQTSVASPEDATATVRRPSKPKTVHELCSRFQAWADKYYRLPGLNGHRLSTREADNIKDALRNLREVIPKKHPAKVRAEDLIDVQDHLINQGLARSTINARIRRAKMAFRWATEPPQRWLPSGVIVDLDLVKQLTEGRTGARETSKVVPAKWSDVTDVMAIVPPTQSHIYTMIELHWMTGMRPGELCLMDRSDLHIEQAKLSTGKQLELMVYKPGREYRPGKSKGHHRGMDRNIFLPPEARRIVEDRLKAIPPEQQRLWPLTGKSYGHALRDFQVGHKLNRWSPNQIRHAFGTRIRSATGIDATQVLMGHRNRSTTEIYALPDASAAIEAIFKFGGSM